MFCFLCAMLEIEITAFNKDRIEFYPVFINKREVKNHSIDVLCPFG